MAGAYSPDAFRMRQDRLLVQRLLAGDEAAFERFADENFTGLMRFALSRLSYDEALAQDIVQSTLCTAIDRLEAFRGESTLLTWLCGICHFEIRGHFRRHRRRGQEVELDDQLPESPAVVDGAVAAGPFVALQDKEMQGLVLIALEQLPERYSEILQWKYLEEASVKDIAERLAVGPKAAESKLTRARNAFRGAFESVRKGTGDGGFEGLRLGAQEGSD